MKDKNIFRNDFLGIEIEKPSEWQFMPSSWLDYAKQSNDEFKTMFDEKRINPAVFGIVYKPNVLLSVYPTVQCRLSFNEGKSFSEIKSEVLDSMNQYFSEVEILEDTDDFIISGKRCSSTRARLTLNDQLGDVYRFVTQQIVVTYPKYFLMISFSSEESGEFSCQNELIEIMRSLKLKF